MGYDGQRVMTSALNNLSMNTRTDYIFIMKGKILFYHI